MSAFACEFTLKLDRFAAKIWHSRKYVQICIWNDRDRLVRKGGGRGKR